MLEFEVCDTSNGIANNDLKNVFKLFNKNDNRNSGLGLSIAKQMVEVLGGEIYVSSREGVGTVFTFTLPFKTKKNTSRKSKKSECHRDIQAETERETVSYKGP